MCRQNQQENLMFIKEQQAELRHLMQKQSALLANKKEVKRLSDLIIMEQRVSLYTRVLSGIYQSHYEYVVFLRGWGERVSIFKNNTHILRKILVIISVPLLQVREPSEASSNWTGPGLDLGL